MYASAMAACNVNLYGRFNQTYWERDWAIELRKCSNRICGDLLRLYDIGNACIDVENNVDDNIRNHEHE